MFNHSRAGLLSRQNKNNKLGEECGIFGGYCKNGDIAPHIKTGLFKLQHRGQESAGMSTGEISQILHKSKGLVNEVFDEKSMQKLTGKFGIGHVRYSTQGGSANVINAQPFLIESFGGQVSVAHNGNIKSASDIRKTLEKMGENFITDSDSEVLLKKVAYELKKSPEKWSFEEIGDCLNKNFSQGAYSVVFYLPNKIIAYRDPFGYKPLMFCEVEEGFFIASEDVAFSSLKVEKIIEIKAGWGVEINSNGYEIKQFSQKNEEKKCIFEHIYFANSASNIFGSNVYESRIALGKLLAKNDNIDADVVVPVMNSGIVAAKGYANESGIPFEIGFKVNNTERSFIQPTQQARIETVKEKLTPIKSIVEGKRIVLVDDSIVRGTTSLEVIQMLRTAGAKEIHLRLSSSMILNTCSWGVDIPTKEELLAVNYKTEQEIAKYIGADSVKYLSLGDLKQHFGEGWCYNCLMTNVEKCGDSKCQQLMKTPALV